MEILTTQIEAHRTGAGDDPAHHSTGCCRLGRKRGYGTFAALLRDPTDRVWVAVEELKLSCHTPETMLFTISPYCGNLN